MAWLETYFLVIGRGTRVRFCCWCLMIQARHAPRTLMQLILGQIK